MLNSFSFTSPPLVLTLVLLFTACKPYPNGNSSKDWFDISINNSSPHDLDWVELVWTGPYVPGGIISQGITSTALATYFPTDQQAILRFVDDSTRDPFSIEIPLTGLHRIDPLTVETLTFVITSYTTAEVHVNGKKISEASAPATPASDLTRE